MKHRLNIISLIAGVLSGFFFLSQSPYLYGYLFVVLGIFIFSLSRGVLILRMNYFLNSVCKIKQPYVLLTFDDGPDPATTPLILNILSQHGIKAIFFMIGAKVEKHPDLVRQIMNDGHLIGNHTYSHSNSFPLFSEKKVSNEIKKTNDIIHNITGKNIELFRPPIGYTNPIIARVVKSLGMTVVGWEKRSFDTVLTNPERLKNRLLKLTKPGSIILLHDNLQHTVDALPSYISEASKKGILFVNENAINTVLK